MRPSPGSLWKNAADRWHFRVRLDKRHAFPMPPAISDADAERKRDRMRALVTKLRASKADVEGAAPYLEALAAAQDTPSLVAADTDVLRYIAGKVGAKLGGNSTIADVAEGLTSGRLAAEFPDHVRAMRPLDPRRSYLTQHVVPSVGHIRVVKFTLDDALRFLADLPGHLSQTTRAAIAGTLDLVLTISAFPLRLIPVSPLPRKWAPRPGKPPARAFLYPDEDRKLLGCTEIQLGKRVLYGFLAREGARTIEARRMTWSDFDLARGTVRLDVNKTDDPRAWVLGEDVVRAMLAWKNVLARILKRPVRGDDPVFMRRGGKVIGKQDAGIFRLYLRRAGVTREDLHVRRALWAPIRIHDLRASFITLALAMGRTETWVADRTGHKSSDMINEYRRAARHAGELGLGWFAPMDEAIPELAGAADVGNVKAMKRRTG